MSKNTRKYPKTDIQDQKDTIQKLKAQIRNLKKEVKNLKSENKTLLDAWTKTSEYLYEITNGLSLEDLLKDNKSHKLADEIERDRKAKNDEKEKVRKKWAEWNKRKKVDKQE